MSFGSNVRPRKFGRGRETIKPWDCAGCGHHNMAWRKKCEMCELDKELTKQIEESE